MLLTSTEGGKYHEKADDLAVRPVITLKPDSVILSGNGTSDSPYTIG